LRLEPDAVLVHQADDRDRHPEEIRRHLGDVVSLVVTLFLIGSGLNRSALQMVGRRPLIQGFVLWVLMGGGTLGAILSGWNQLQARKYWGLRLSGEDRKGLIGSKNRRRTAAMASMRVDMRWRSVATHQRAFEIGYSSTFVGGSPCH
jgi:hypothetical protein